MVEIFITNVNNKKDADRLIEKLSKLMKQCEFNFDLEDYDKILRVASDSDAIDTTPIIKLLNFHDFNCELLTD